MSGYSKPDAVGELPQNAHVYPPRQVQQNQNPQNQRGYGHTQVFDAAYSSEELQREPEDAEYEYQFSRAVQGLAVLIINDIFHSGDNRVSAQQDFEKMQNVFVDLGFEIRAMRNKTTRELHKELTDVASENIMQHIDCLAVVISSHGSEEELKKKDNDDMDLPDDVSVFDHYIATKDSVMRTRHILRIFDDDHCPPLRKRPKLFFIQACRSRNDMRDPEKTKKKALDEGVSVDVTVQRQQGVTLPQHDPDLARGHQYGQRPQHQSHIDAKATMPQHIVDEQGKTYYEHTDPELKSVVIAPPSCLNHFLVMFASMSETYGWSDDRGGWLLNNLYDVLKERIRRNQRFSLMTALLEVTRKVATFCKSKTEDGRLDDMKMMPCLEYKLAKEIFLSPRPER